MRTGFSSLSFDQALSKSKAQRKILFVAVTANGCASSARLEEECAKPGALKGVQDRVLAIRVGIDDDLETAARLRVEKGKTPQLLYFSHGTEIHREEGMPRA